MKVKILPRSQNLGNSLFPNELPAPRAFCIPLSMNTRSMVDPVNPKEWLHAEFCKRREKNPAYSLRAFGKFLKISPSRLSEVLSDKRLMTSNQGARIAERLAYSPEMKKKFLECIEQSRGVTRGQVIFEASIECREYRQMQMDSFHLIADWYHFAILSLMETRSFKSDVQWIARRLGISIMEARQAAVRLKRLGFLVEVNGKWKAVSKDLATSNEVSSAALRKSHRQTLEQALTALEEVPLDQRDVTSISMAIDVNKLPAAKKMIQKFRRSLSVFLESGSQTEVYNLNVQLLPVTKPVKKGDRK